MEHVNEASSRSRVLQAFIGFIMLILGGLHIFGPPIPNPLVTASEATAQEIATSTAAVYISLRAVNAALSTAQEVEVGLSALFGQGGFQPFKVLEPVDDTIERVSEVVFIVSSFAAIALVGLGPIVGLGFLALGVGLVASSACASSAVLAPWHSTCTRLARVGFLVAVLLPVAFICGVWLGETATLSQWNASVAVLDSVTREAQIMIGRDIPNAVAGSSGGNTGPLAFIWDFTDWVSDATEAAQRYSSAIELFFDRADEILGASLTIIGIFILRMILLPVLLLWFTASFFRMSFRA